ncbi:MAG: trigger factor [Deltaproteobacteria bacterium]|nr:trigger factor [Deltaproteobacteria bacterium]
MQVQLEALSAARRQLTLQIPAAEVNSAYGSVVAKIGARVRIPGFRPGKAPAAMLERRYGPAIREEVLEKLVTRALPKALDAEKAAPLGTPELAEVGEIKRGAPLELRFVFDVLPELELNGWEGATITPDRLAVDDQDVEQAVDALLQKHASVEDVADAAQDEDVVTLRYTLTAGETTTEQTERRVVVGGGVAWLSAAVLGKSAGDAVETEVSVPDEEAGDFAGQTATLKGEIAGVRRRILPTMEAVCAAEGVDDEAALTARERAALERQCERRNKMLDRNAVVDHIVATCAVEAPEALVQREIEWQAQRMFGGQLDLRDPRMGRLLDALRDRFRPDAVAGVQRALVVRHLVEQEKVEVSDELIQARIDEMIVEMPESADEIRRVYGEPGEGLDDLRVRLEEEVVLDALLAKVTVEPGEARPWRARDAAPAGEAEAHDHDHDHDHDHGHDHDHDGHVHGPDCNHD